MSNELHNKLDLVKDSVKKAKREIDTDWLDIKEQYNFDHSGESLRKYSVGWKLLEEWGLINYNNIKIEDDKLPTYKETSEYKSDGSYVSDKLVKLADDDLKNPEKLLEVHGFDKNKWQLTNAKNSMWNSGVDNTLHSSRITVKPIVDGFDFEKVLNKVLTNKSVFKYDKITDKGENLLEIFLTDMHFGVNTYEDYRSTLQELVSLIKSKRWDTIYIPIGSDLLHNDDFKGRTTNDTPIEKVDMELAWEEAYNFYNVLLQKALQNSNKVVAKYVCGNHDKTMSFGLVKTLSKVFPDIDWDTTTKNKKLFTWNDIAILAMHGDRGSQRIGKTVYKEYGKLIADKKVVEIHTGDKHHTKVDDNSGVIFRILPTKAKVDEWHEEQSFTGSMRCFHIFEYSKDKLKTIYHI